MVEKKEPMKLTVRLDVVGGEPMEWEVPYEEGMLLRGIAVAVNGDDIMRQSFSMHEPGALHTICRWPDSGVDSREW